MAEPLLVWDPKMLDYNFGPTHPFNPVRWDLTYKLADRMQILDHFTQLDPIPASDDALARIHTREYIAAVRTAGQNATPGHSSNSRHTALGHGLGSEDNPAFPHMHHAAALIAGGSIAAAKAIAAGETHRAVNFAGGLHHAMADAASGFCVYNDAALAIAALLDAGVERVAYVDVDVHHGDGVQAAFYGDPRVLTISIHESPVSLWPGTGWAGECGAGPAAGTAINLPVPSGTADAEWLRAFDAVVPSAVTAFRPQVLVTQHGADSHRDDPLADLNLSVNAHAAAQRTLRDLAESTTGGRWLALGGGGYSLVRVVPRSWTHLLAVTADRDLDPSTPVPDPWYEDVRHADGGRFAGTSRMPTTMGDGGTATDQRVRWNGHGETPVDREILRTRMAVFPYLGLDPRDPRD